ncbi:MAG TPA: M20/M25/M40 family metallo-hydrolase [Chloroflexia bacterium]|nr:M20/M25/M40 family metallo-hydrolase [Chloroflexia bacterium]
MSAVDEYIDAHLNETLSRLKKWAAQPSISTEHLGIEEMAKLAVQDFRRSGFQADVYPTEGHPVVLASIGPSGQGVPTLLVYNHYDVQPTGEASEWESDPFDPQVRDGKMYGRGVADTKSNVVSRLAALDAIRAVHGDLPIRVVCLLEGEEEIGSPHLDPFILAHRDELVADGCIWEFGGYTWEGRPNVTLGLKGMLSVELVATTANRDLHSGNASHVPSPVWELVWALNRIKTPDGKIHIPGFYDKVHVPTDAQEALLGQMPDDTERDRVAWGLTEYVNGMKGIDVLRASNFVPTANILGIEAGYNGPGTKTVLPHTAHAKLDLRLVPDQHPEEIFQALTTFLKDEGFHNIEVKRIDNEGDLLPGISDPESPFVQTVLRALREANGQEPVITPSSGGSGPVGVFVLPPPAGLGLQIAAIGTGYPDTRSHGPNENIRLDDFRAHIHTFARLVELMGEGRQ